MKVLAILQNQWFEEPERIRGILERNPKARPRIITYSLFAGCRTGVVLRSVFGRDFCSRTTWEEASPNIGGHASSSFPADRQHLREVLEREQPDLVLAFGRIASDALATLVPAEKLITGPHPTARGPDTERGLHAMKEEVFRRVS